VIERAEALAQLSRLLGDESLRAAAPPALQDALQRGHERIAAGLVAEAADSDDVSDRDSAVSYVDLRLAALASVLPEPEQARIARHARDLIGKW